MKIMCDTNVILDVMLEREPFVEASASVLQLCENKSIEGYTTASCITDIFYIVRKYLHSTDKAYYAVEKVLEIVKVCDVKAQHVQKALQTRAYDFEDCLVATCAKSIGCDFLISRDKKGFAELNINVLTPDELLQHLTTLTKEKCVNHR